MKKYIRYTPIALVLILPFLVLYSRSKAQGPENATADQSQDSALLSTSDQQPQDVLVDDNQKRARSNASNLIPVLVQLRDTPLAVVYAKAIGGSAAPKKGELEAARIATQSQVSVIRQKQQQLGVMLRGPAIQGREIYRVQSALNGIAIEVSRDKLRALRSLPGVKSVTVIELEYPTNSTSVPFLGTPQVWSNTLGLNAKGDGIKIGVIDTGIDYQHANFGGTGVLTDYQANNRTVAPDAYYPSAKVVGGTDFAGDTYNGSNLPAPDPDPMDCNGHGSHVAGTAAGYGVNSDGTPYAGPFTELVNYAGLRIGPGAAPGASLYAVRVFGCGGATNLTVQAIEWTMDPNGDADLSDHLDVINMSLGSSFGTLASTSAEASDNAALAGVIVVTSAGNSGDTYFISGSPGSGSRVIATAASYDPGSSGPAPIVRVNTPPGIAGFYSATTAEFGSRPPAAGITGNVIMALDPADGAGPLTTDGCSPLTNAAAIAGNIALIDRGTCGFAVKAKSAQDAGAIGVIIANNASAFGNMAGVDPTVTIPTVMLTQADGNTLKANLAGLNITLYSPADLVASFSSRGPRGGSSPGQLKPDITAPGVSITSSQTGVTCTGVAPSSGCQVPNATGYIVGNAALVLNGTSMAAPHMAGIMALLRQLHPTWTVEEMKAVAMNGALHDLTTQGGGNGTRYGPGRIGAGRVDPINSAQSAVIAYNAEEAGLVSITFNSVVLGSLNQTKNVRVVNHGPTAQTFDLALDTVVDAPGVDFSLPGGSSITVAAGQTVEFGVQMSATASLMTHSRDLTLSTTQSVPSPGSIANLFIPRHWLTDESGYVTFSQSGTLKMRVPIYATPRAASSMSAPSTIVTGGAGTGSTTIPLTGTDVCTGTLGAGPACTGTFPNDEVSLVSAFELQVASPRDTINTPGNADLQYAGVSTDGSRIWFGVTTWEDWSTPNDVSFSIYVDNNSDGTYDRIIFNTSAGILSSRIFGSTSPAQDNFITSVYTPPNLFSNVLAASTPNFVNRLNASAIDSALFNTNSMFFGATPAQLGLADTNSPFRYKIETCPGFAPLCQAFNGFHYDEAVGPYSWSGATPGLDFGAGTLLQDLNGASIPVTWNTANMTANGSLGGLLLHHHNAPGNRAEVILLDTAQSADLMLQYSAAPSNPNLGQNVTLELLISNQGLNPASGIVVTDELPGGLTYVSDDGGGAFDPGTGQWTVGSLAYGAGAILHITATVNTTDQILSTARITSGTPLDPNPVNNEASVTLMAPRLADLAIGMNVSNPTTLVGSPVTYTLTVTNNGDDPAYSLNVGESFTGFPALDPTSFVASQGSYNPATGTWNLASLGKGFSATLALTLNAPNMAGALTNQATASSSTTDSNSSNNTASATTTVLSPANVTGTKTKSGGDSIGSTVTYTVILSNSASYAQQNNTGDEFTDVLPASLTLVSATATSGTAATAANTVTWNGSVPASGSVTVTITATINSGTALQSISNQGTINYDSDGNGTNEANRVTDDPSVGGANDPTSFTVLSPANVFGTKTKSGGNAPGSAITYTVILSNSGSAPQLDNSGNEFTDPLPASLTLVSATATSGTASTAANTVNWNGSIPAEGSVTITINATINNVPDGTVVSNQGTINYDADGNGTNETPRLTDDPGVAGGSNPTVFNVVDPNDPPDAVDDALSSVAEDPSVRVIPFATLKANDTAGPPSEIGQTLTLTGVSNPLGGTVTHDGTNVSFTPTANYNGPASFQYTITDNGMTGGSPDPKSDTATASFTITEVNDAPTAVSESLSDVAEDSGQRSIPFATLTANDSKGPANESGQTLIVKTVGNPVGGTVSISGGNVLFTPTANYNGPAGFDYTVEDNGTTNGAADPKTSGSATTSFNITDINDAPTAVNDTLTNIAEDSAPRAISFAELTGNDSKGPANESGQTLIVASANNAVGGSVLVVNGFVVFTLTEDYNGPASFSYTVQDDGTSNGVPDPKTSSTATVNFNITEVNDAPTAVNDTLANVAEDSGERTITFAELTSNDSKGPADESGQSLIVLTVSNPVGVTVSIVAGTVRITPLPNFNGAASFQYTVRDNGTTNGFANEKSSVGATVSFNINGVADTPSVTNATTNANKQTILGLVISRNPADGAEVTHFRVTGITGGSLFKNDGTTPINNGDFITFAEGSAGLKFTPGTTNGSFTVQASTSASDAGLGGGTATAAITINPLGGVLKFSAANYDVAEGAGFSTITVERNGDTSQAVTVDYASSDHSVPSDFIPCNSSGAGHASSRCDFTTAIGTLRFAADETSKTFNVLITNDNYVEGPETLDLTLANPTGGAVFGVPQTAILSITDDVTEPATNPIDTSSEFVRAQYHDILHREPDPAGLAFWVDNIERCNDASRRPPGQTVPQCIDKQREATAVAFFNSPEFQITGGFVYHLYKGSLTGSPNYDGGSPGRFPTALEFLKDVSTVSEGIVVNNQISGAVVEANRNRLVEEFVLRPEFVAKYGGLNNTLYVQELFNTTAITATAAQTQALVDGLTGGAETRASVLRKVVDGTVVISESNVQFTTPYGQAFINQEFRRVFVFMEYIGYLRRNPDTAGFVFWLAKLNLSNGDPFAAEMVRSFILSPEYRSRFGQ